MIKLNQIDKNKEFYIVKTTQQQLKFLSIFEFLIFLATFSFMGLDVYAQHYLAQNPEIVVHKTFSFLPLMIGLVVLVSFFISMIIKVRSVLQFSVVCLLALVQLWLSYCFLSSGAYPFLEYSASLGTVIFIVLSGLHFHVGHRLMNVLNQQEFVL